MELPPPIVQPNDNNENEVAVVGVGAGAAGERNLEIEQRRKELALNNPHLSPTDINFVSRLPLAEQREAMQRIMEHHQNLEEHNRRIQTLRRLTEQLDELNRRLLRRMDFWSRRRVN